MAKKSLWGFYDGEPFMENPHIAVVGLNPRKKGKKMAARRKNPRRRGRKNSPRRRARRNFPTAGLAFNPRKRRNPRRRRRNPVHHMRKHRRHARRNPALLGVALPPVQMIAWGAGGFIGAPMVEGFINKFLPASLTTSTIGRYAVKIGTVLGLTWLVKTLMSNKEAFPVAMGGSMYIVVSAVNEFAPQLTQTTSAAAVTTGTKAYRGGMINAYRGGMIATGVGAYSKGGFNGALPGLARALPGLAAGPASLLPAWNITNSGMRNPVQADPRFAAFGSTAQ
jgi:hypothetical protein